MKLRNSIFLFFLVIICSCKYSNSGHNGNKGQCFLEVDLNNGLNNPNEYYLSEIAKDINLIKLETNEKCQIENIVRVYVIKKRIIILSRSYTGINGVHPNPGRLFVFSSEGKFINEVGRVGKGPGEYTFISNITLDEKEELIYVLSSNKIILQYDLNGEFIRQMEVPFIFFDFSIFYGSLLFHFSPYNVNENSNYMFAKTNLNLDPIERFVKYEENPRAYYRNEFYKLDNQYHYWNNLFNDTIYSVDKKFRLSPRIFFQYENQMPIDSRIDVRKFDLKYSYISNFLETQNFFFITMIHKRKLVNVCYNKDSLMSFRCNNNRGFLNDLNGGLDFYPKGKIDDNTIYSIWDIIAIEEFFTKNDNSGSNMRKKSSIKFPDKKRELAILLSKSKVTDNPILVFVDLKQ
jgi:hypothetical protein